METNIKKTSELSKLLSVKTRMSDDFFIFLASLASVTYYLAFHWRNRTEFRLRSCSSLFASSALWARASIVYANIRYMSFQIMVRTVSIA